jgi:hypothetical protein
MSIRSFHGDDTDNDGFYTDKHGIYPSIPGKSPVLVDGITECTVSAGPYTVDSPTFADVHGRAWMSTNEQDLSWLRRYTWSYRDWPCIVRDQSVYNPYTSMLVYRKYSNTVPVVIHSHFGGYTVPPGLCTEPTRLIFARDDRGEKLNMFIILRSLPDGPGRLPVFTRFMTVYYGPPRKITDHHKLTVQDDPACHL